MEASLEEMALQSIWNWGGQKGWGRVFTADEKV